MSSKTTVNATLTAAYQSLITLAGGANGIIPIGNSGGGANKVFITILTNHADIAWGKTAPLPSVAGHRIAANDAITLGNMGEIRDAWLRNTVGASAATAVITSYEVHE